MQIIDIGLYKIERMTNDSFLIDYKVNDKSIFLPRIEAMERINIGQKYLLAIVEDDDYTFASQKIEKHISGIADAETYQIGDEVDVVIYRFSPLGANVLIDLKYKGMIYQNELFRKIEVGKKIKAYIKFIRTDGKIDLSLSKLKFKDALNDAKEVILNKLNENNGFLNLTDNSSPEEIRDVLEMSKKAFKRAAGSLFRDEKVELSDTGIVLKK
jgi:predicted RNA-binding protein (virulence factor B family)